MRVSLAQDDIGNAAKIAVPLQASYQWYEAFLAIPTDDSQHVRLACKNLPVLKITVLTATNYGNTWIAITNPVYSSGE